MRAMILAAGRGERMRPLTDHTPKVLLEAGGKPLLQWHVEKLAQVAIEPIVINHAWLGEQIERRLGDGSRFGTRLVYSREREALDTAGGIANALPLLGDEPFLVINGDVFTDLDFASLRPHWHALRAGHLLAHLLLVDNPPHHMAGDFALSGDRVHSEGEPRLTFSGIGLYHPDLFAAVVPGQPAPLAPLLRTAMTRAAVTGQRYPGLWVDVGTPERLEDLNRRLAPNGGLT